MINYEDFIPGSRHFKWKEALWLPQWNRCANDEELTQEILDAIIETAIWMDKIRDFFGSAINVHCWLRPDAYNKLVKGAKSSMHLKGRAVDFDVEGMSCDDARKKIMDSGLLDTMQLRMEDNGEGAPWLHLDDKELAPGGHRYFKP